MVMADGAKMITKNAESLACIFTPTLNVYVGTFWDLANFERCFPEYLPLEQQKLKATKLFVEARRERERERESQCRQTDGLTRKSKCQLVVVVGISISHKVCLHHYFQFVFCTLSVFACFLKNQNPQLLAFRTLTHSHRGTIQSINTVGWSQTAKKGRERMKNEERRSSCCFNFNFHSPLLPLLK